MSYKVYSTSDEALHATDDFYLSGGFQYKEDRAVNWLKANVKLPRVGKILDLCCGDGIWSYAIQKINPKLEIYGVDISAGGLAKAKQLLLTDDEHLLLADTEKELPFDNGFFDLIFARGPGLYNQHNMSRPETVKVIEMWHRKLKNSGLFYSIFASRPEKMGEYTSMEDSKLPFNRSPRKTETVDFRGGKYHHSVESFHQPFWLANNVEIVQYKFINNLHVLTSRLQQGEA